jgi:thiol-disulfide isomerase/thioredoxin/outer membrane protein assembly factor BamD (BamD/ComL family)
MKVLSSLRPITVAIVSLLGWTGVAHAQCEATTQVRPILTRSVRVQEINLTRTEKLSQQTKILDEGLAAHPDDYFLLRSRMLVEPDKDSQVRWAEALQNRFPNRPVYALLHAMALEGKNTPEAIQMLEALETAHPESAQVHLELTVILGNGYSKFVDKVRAQHELDSFFKLCPAISDEFALYALTLGGTTEQMVQAIPSVRKHLQLEKSPFQRGSWETLWRMEFKVRPPAEHEQVRHQIDLDLARFEQSPERNHLALLMLLRSGYQNANHPEALEKIGDEILSCYPGSDEADQIMMARWEHKFPGEPDTSEAGLKAQLAEAEELHKRWPENHFILLAEFGPLEDLDSAPADRIARAADELLPAHRNDPRWRWWPFEYDIANAYLKHKVRLDQVSALVEDGYRNAVKPQKDSMADDRYSKETLSILQGRIDSLTLTRMSRLLDLYDATKQPEKAHAFDEELKSFNLVADYKSDWLETRAHAAELEGNKLDALLFYRAAMAARSAVPKGKDTLAESVQRLWKAMGGTPAAYDLLFDTSKTAKVNETVWNRPTNPLPAFTVPDLAGKTWKLKDLEGKALIINIWATWCPPCREELPELQKLYEKMKTRTDVAVLSLNVDDDIGKVGPYMQENKYSFPVLLGHDLVDSVSKSGYPQTWIVSPKGKLEWIKTGFYPARWQEIMTEKLEASLKQTN